MAFTEEQQKLLAIVPRLAGGVSLCSALYMIYSVLSSPIYRSRMYHRLILGTAVNVTFFGLTQMWGTSAVPTGTPNVYGASGTVATCSVMGFSNQFFGFSVPSYYAALSILAYISARNDYQFEKYAHVEKWIHIGVHVFPLLSAIYLLIVEAYNYSGHTCWIASEPLGCGDGTEVGRCTRGPQQIGLYQWIFAGMPVILLLLFPTFLMLALYNNVKRRQKEIKIEAKVVALQSSLYLLALYWTYCFSFINGVILFAADEHLFGMAFASATVECLLGFWILLAYLWFRERTSRSHQQQQSKDSNTSYFNMKRHLSRVISATTSTTKAEDEHNNNNDRRTSHPTLEKNTPSGSVAATPPSSASRACETFSIFDGTNPSAVWSGFVHEGDEDDDEEDDMEAKHWEGVVQT